MRLLLVEDAPQLAEATARGLRGHGHAVDIAGTLAEARRQVRLEPYDALLLDLGLPDGNGVTLLDELRRTGATTPVIVLTARDGVDDRVSGLDHGADDYLVKPFALAELEARLRALARRMPAWRPDEVVVDDRGGRLHVCSDSDHCARRREAGHRGPDGDVVPAEMLGGER